MVQHGAAARQPAHVWQCNSQQPAAGAVRPLTCSSRCNTEPISTAAKWQRGRRVHGRSRASAPKRLQCQGGQHSYILTVDT